MKEPSFTTFVSAIFKKKLIKQMCFLLGKKHTQGLLSRPFSNRERDNASNGHIGY